MNNVASIGWDPLLLRRYDQPGPRYTSYPTAPQFREDFDTELFDAAIARGNQAARPLSLYFHIPFCETVCYYCACNKIITANKKRVQPYLLSLADEIARMAVSVERGRAVKQLHWGGGTPTYLNHHQMAWLMAVIGSYFDLTLEGENAGEHSIEVHPGLTHVETIDFLREIGFNRLSLGIQDFNFTVQQAVNRFNSEEQVQSLVDRARELDYRSISVDLIYGLPKQNTETFARTLDSVIAINPDRLSLFNYAHMPLQFKTQRQINPNDLPDPQEKLAMLSLSIQRLTEAGYVYIGMDHFAKPEDELTRAQQRGELQRNFQGYSTSGGCDLLAFGVSAISALDDVYVQNAKDIATYTELLEQGRKPIVKGYRLSHDDRIRRAVINQLICHFVLDFATINKEFGISFKDYFDDELMQLQTMANDGLLTIDAKGIRVHATGRLLIRHICMAFDAYLSQPKATVQYSRII